MKDVTITDYDIATQIEYSDGIRYVACGERNFVENRGDLASSQHNIIPVIRLRSSANPATADSNIFLQIIKQ